MKNLFVIFLSVLSISANSQQDPFLSGDVLTTPIWHNPASFGTWNKFSANAIGNFITPNPSWDPKFFQINSEFKFGYNKNDKMSYDRTIIQSGAGVNFYYDRISFSESMLATLNYNIQIKLKKNSRLSIGISPGVQKIAFDTSFWVPPTNVADPNIPYGSQTKFTLGGGLMYYSKKLYVGISSTHLVETNFENLGFTAARHYYLNSGYKIPITRNFTIFPIVNLASDGASMSYSTLVLFLYKLNYSAGLGYGRGNNIRAMVGYELKNFMLQYFI